MTDDIENYNQNSVNFKAEMEHTGAQHIQLNRVHIL